jgi:HNH endonuclease
VTFAIGDRDKYLVDATTGCWLWQGAKSDGYGSMTIGQKRVKAHRYFWEKRHGTLPPDFDVHHAKCKSRACVNPDHLEAVHKSRHRGHSQLWGLRSLSA